MILMPMNSRFKLLLLLLFLVSCFGAAAQKFNWQAPVAPVAESGYHRILLSPEVTGYAEAGFADLRLYNTAGEEVPYLLRTEEPVQYRRLFRPYNILSYTHQTGCCSELIIANPEQRKINNISLLIRNADVQKKVALSGSDNQQDWYVLKAQDVLYAIENTEGTAEVKLLDFPLSDYKFFRLQLNDSTSAPLNILKAGYYDTFTESGKYTLVPHQKISRTDSAATKKTYLHLLFPLPVYPERLEFDITAPALYYRQARVLTKAEQPRRRGLFRKRRRREAVAPAVSFVLHSNEPATVTLPRRQVEELTIEIENADNPPLTIAAVKVYQLNRYLVADLEAGESYVLRFGNAKAKTPDYELSYFKEEIPENLPVLQTGNIENVSATTDRKTPTSKIIIWAAIALVVAGLAFMTVRLLNEMKRG